MSIPTLFDKMRNNRRRFKPFVPEELYPGDYVRLKSQNSQSDVMYILQRLNDGVSFVLSDGLTYNRSDFMRYTFE